ncbi:MAG: hypothetical protein HZB39_05510 [Planctomycetes bacterium]|nr:hypothetical protein [Planctomycetota bacterium]
MTSEVPVDASCGSASPNCGTGSCAACSAVAGTFPPAETAVLGDAYAVISELWCRPVESTAEQEAIRNAAARVAERLGGLEPRAGLALARFLEASPLTEEDYIDLFELQPKCSLYLGSHTYDEPETCAGAGVSDRNEYMIELVGIYRHFGHMLDGSELPDYLPLMCESLSLTSEYRGDPIRTKLIQEYILPFLGPIRGRLQELATPHRHLMEAFEGLMALDVGAPPQPERSEECTGG